MDPSYLGVWNRYEAAGETLWPGRATKSGRGYPHDRAGDGYSTLGQDYRSGEDPLKSQAGQRKHIHCTQE
jgi:hypothetical protein